MPKLNDVIDQLQEVTKAPMTLTGPLTGAPAPKLATQPGDLVVIVGLDDDALRAVPAAAAGAPAVRVGGSIHTGGVGRVDDRNSAVTARAEAVLSGASVIVAFGLGTHSTAAATAKGLSALSPDQVWLAVDAALKPEDTASWAEIVRKTVRSTPSWSSTLKERCRQNR